MRNRYITEECNKILNFWKLEEYFTPSDYPELTLTIKEGKQDILFDAYYNAYSTRSLPLKEYKAHNEYLSKNINLMRSCIIVQMFIVAVTKLKPLWKKWLKNVN